MKVDLYKSVKAKEGEPSHLYYKTVYLPLIPNVFDQYIDEESGNCFRVKQRFIGEGRVALLLGKPQKKDRYKKLLFDQNAGLSSGMNNRDT